MGAQRVFDFGEEVGAASVVKLAGNFLLASAIRSLFEALSMVRSSGVDPQAALDMLTQSLFGAPIYKSYGQRIVDRVQLFTQNAIPLKDVGLFQAAAHEAHRPTPLADALHQLLETTD